MRLDEMKDETSGESCGAKRFDIKRNKWERLPAMNEARSGLSSCTLANSLYVIGGSIQNSAVFRIFYSTVFKSPELSKMLNMGDSS